MSDDTKTVFRSKHRRDYTTLSNALICNPNLSGKAKWVLIYLLSKPEDWVTRVSDIVNHTTDGRSAILSAINELKQAGYLRKVRVVCPDTKRVLRWETHVFDEPQPDLLNTDSQDVENPDSGNPHSGKSNTTKYGSLEKTEDKNPLPLTTTTKSNSRSSQGEGGRNLDLEKAEREKARQDDAAFVAKEVVKACNDLFPSLEIEYTKSLVSACLDRNICEALGAIAAMQERISQGALRRPAQYLASAIKGRYVPPRKWIQYNWPNSPIQLVEYLEQRWAEELAG